MDFTNTQNSFISRNESMATVNITADATRTISADESGATFLMNKAAGIVFTLPTPVAGMKYKFVIGTDVTSTSYKIITGTPASEFIYGTVVMGVEATTPAANPGPKLFSGNGSTHVAITQNGTTTGGLKGTTITLQAVSSTLWAVTGIVLGSGAIATPFATS